MGHPAPAGDVAWSLEFTVAEFCGDGAVVAWVLVRWRRGRWVRVLVLDGTWNPDVSRVGRSGVECVLAGPALGVCEFGAVVDGREIWGG